MSATRISVNIDEGVKKEPQAILSELGLDMTTAVDIFLRTLIRKGGIPFAIRTEKAIQEDQYRQHILNELGIAKVQAADPNTKWLSYDDVMQELNKQRETRHGI